MFPSKAHSSLPDNPKEFLSAVCSEQADAFSYPTDFWQKIGSIYVIQRAIVQHLESGEHIARNIVTGEHTRNLAQIPQSRQTLERMDDCICLQAFDIAQGRAIDGYGDSS
jgi:hypothetical protein